MLKYLASKSVLFHLVMLNKGVDYFTHPKNLSEKNKIGEWNQKNDSKKKILIVGMSESPHLHTWIDGLAESGLVEEIWLFPSDFPVRRQRKEEIRIREFPYFKFGTFSDYSFRVLDILTSRYWRSYFLFREIRRVRPTHIHFQETQHAAYLYNPIARHPKNNFPGKLIVSTWGSDLIFYGKLQSHHQKIVQVMSWATLLTSERTEDFEIAVDHGYSGKFLAPVYITIGNKVEFRDLKKTSERVLVVVKGIQNTHGRALNALESVEKLASEMNLSKYKFRVFSASRDVRPKIEQMQQIDGLDIQELPRMPKNELMNYFAEARAYIGLAISDGLSTSMVEAMANGAFPIQSENSAAPNFLKAGVTGGVVNPWKIEEIAQILKSALTDDVLVDLAAATNLQTLTNKYNWQIGLAKIKEVYE
jgi:glycosyltransferase involved in cell wall biosynthesis